MRIKMWIVVLFAMVLSACSPSPTSESTGEYIDSTAITTKVKASLVEKLGTKAFAVKVKTYKDVVQLSGFVDSETVKVKAGEVASLVGGVSQVRNDLLVKR